MHNALLQRNDVKKLSQTFFHKNLFVRSLVLWILLTFGSTLIDVVVSDWSQRITKLKFLWHTSN